jgi:hypothetical protein
MKAVAFRGHCGMCARPDPLADVCGDASRLKYTKLERSRRTGTDVVIETTSENTTHISEQVVRRRSTSVSTAGAPVYTRRRGVERRGLPTMFRPSKGPRKKRSSERLVGGQNPLEHLLLIGRKQD